MNIQITQECEQTIKEVARSIEETAICEGTSAQNFKLDTAIQITKMQRRCWDRQELEDDIFKFIGTRKPNICHDIKSFFREIAISFNKSRLSLAFLFLIGVILTIGAKCSYSNDNHTLAVVLFFILILVVIIFLGRFLYLRRYILLDPTTYTKLKNEWNTTATDEFGIKLAKKYSPLILKLEEEDLKIVINGMEQRNKIASAGMIIISVIIFSIIRYLLEDLHKLIINNTSQWIDVGVVFIVSSVFTMALQLGYFNDLIYYKQVGSSLQKAQTYITNKTQL